MVLLSAKETAERWNISQRRVTSLCAAGRVSGATQVGNMWVIPSDTPRPDDARTSVYASTPREVKPFVKWAGGKSQLLEKIRAKYPFATNPDIRKYAEPFVGGGAVLFDVLSNYNLDEVFINDVNQELINTYRHIKHDVDELIIELSQIEHEYLIRDQENRKVFFYEKRSRYNELITLKESSSCLESAVLFIFLNKTCFNGLYRVNGKGLYNVPSGVYKSPKICDESNLRKASKLLEKTHINCGDYHLADDFIDNTTFVYFDPPYRPLTATASFTSYTQEQFNDENQIELAKFIKTINSRGARILLSNSDPKNTNPEDEFFDNLYKNFTIERVQASRAINSKGNGRGYITEILVSNS